MFAPASRYYGIATYTVTLPDGRIVTAVRCALPSPAPVIGFHRRVGDERLDQLAARYLGDATTFWRLCDSNNAMVPASLAAGDLVGIPAGSSST
jgi:hypothetical protein